MLKHRLLCRLLGLLAFSLVVTLPAQANDQTGMPTVSTTDGTLQGLSEDGLMVFRGVPYAAPPTGPLRWRAPQAVVPWQGVRPAQTFGAACVQKTAAQEPERSLQNAPQSEDCLTLNIWAPAAQTTGLRPVMVWIHGGSFRFGAGSLGLYDGADLARQDVIVVTLNYRLGLFGTFAHPALQAAGETEGNFGLLDMMAALRWVQTNIARFGGDPRNVTLFGESAGGVAVSYLTASPLARGLFARAIIESGGLSIPLLSRHEAEAVGLRIGSALHADTAEALRALPTEALRAASAGISDTMPFIDGTLVTQSARHAFEKGDSLAIPLLIGSNDAEAGFFGPRYWQNLPQELGPERWHTLARRCFGYAEQGQDACAEQIASEWFAGANSRGIARAASQRGPVYVYRFAWLPPAERAQARGAIHTAEIPYVFGHVARSSDADPESREISRQLSARWIAFARTGRPDLAEGDWPAYSTQDAGRILLIDARGLHAGTNPADAMLDLIDAMALPPHP